MEEQAIVFDEQHNLRVLNPEKFKLSEQIQEKSTQFADRLSHFDELIKSVMDVIITQGQKIENEKLRAIGLRNRVQGEADTRKMKLQELQSLIQEKQIELERKTIEVESLLKVETEQKKLIERLSNNDPSSSYNSSHSNDEY